MSLAILQDSKPYPVAAAIVQKLHAHGHIAYFAGGTAKGDDEYTQAKAIFAKLKHLVEAAGGAMADIVKVTIFVTDIKNREGVWKARREFFTGNFPTSTLVQIAALATTETKVEIEAIAHIGASKR